MYYKHEISVQLCFRTGLGNGNSMFLLHIVIALTVVLLLVCRSPKACRSLSQVGQQEVKKQATFVISRVTSTGQRSVPPMEYFRVLPTEKAEGSCEGINTFTSIPCAGKGNLRGDPSIKY